MDPVLVENREAALLSLRNFLHGFKTHGWKYHGGDLRWRHVGVRKNRSYFFDMGSLDSCPEEENDVESQVAILRQRMTPTEE
jgi:hypothetical protein